MENLGALGIVAIWSTSEPCLGIVAACLPTMRPLFSKAILELNSLRSGKSSSWRSKKFLGGSTTSQSGRSKSRPRDDNDCQPLRDIQSNSKTETCISSDPTTKYFSRPLGKGLPPNAIEVQTCTRWSGGDTVYPR